MSALLLDTHAWIWLAVGEARIAKHARRLNRAAAANELLICAVSIYEAARIGIETDAGQRRGKRALVMRPTVAQWVREALRGTRVSVVTVGAESTLDAALLHGLHADPFDRMIVSAALGASARLVTADAQLIEFAVSTKLAHLAL